ncbi:MAG: hypothetical protein EXR73_11625 [Myxococcales bacterium]|nr:hypothetical protein [Myxococcales bacterium]
MVRAIREALVASRADTAALVAVVGAPRLARRLDGVARLVVVAAGRGALKRSGGAAVRAAGTKLPLGSARLAGVVGVCEGRGACDELLAEWARAVREDGVVVLVDRGPAADRTRAMMVAGMTELEQRSAGRIVVTSGRIRRL